MDRVLIIQLMPVVGFVLIVVGILAGFGLIITIGTLMIVAFPFVVIFTGVGQSMRVFSRYRKSWKKEQKHDPELKYDYKLDTGESISPKCDEPVENGKDDECPKCDEDNQDKAL